MLSGLQYKPTILQSWHMALLRSLSDRCAPTTQCALAFNGGSAAVSGAAPETAELWASAGDDKGRKMHGFHGKK